MTVINREGRAWLWWLAAAAVVRLCLFGLTVKNTGGGLFFKKNDFKERLEKKGRQVARDK